MQWKFKQFLDSNNVTAYRLTQELGGEVAANLAYGWARLDEPPKHLHTDVLTKVLGGLERITGKNISVSDILEYG